MESLSALTTIILDEVVDFGRLAGTLRSNEVVLVALLRVRAAKYNCFLPSSDLNACEKKLAIIRLDLAMKSPHSALSRR